MFRVVSKFAVPFVMVVLLCSLVCCEFPELARLADDPSNDFTTQSCLASEVAIDAAIQVMPTAPAAGYGGPEIFVHSERLILFGISRDLLPFYSVLRT
jgi:hypothetical protein